MQRRTLEYYETNAATLAERYDRADMRELHALLARHVSSGDAVLDVGFGSGRELLHLHARGIEAWGAEAAEAFIQRLEAAAPPLAGRLCLAPLPELDLPPSFPPRFDMLCCVAVWMHLRAARQPEAIRSIRRRLKPGGKAVLSYSTRPRPDDERFFETLRPGEVAAAFEAAGFKLLETHHSADALSRRTIDWTMQVFEAPTA